MGWCLTTKKKNYTKVVRSYAIKAGGSAAAPYVAILGALGLGAYLISKQGDGGNNNNGGGGFTAPVTNTIERTLEKVTNNTIDKTFKNISDTITNTAYTTTEKVFDTVKDTSVSLVTNTANTVIDTTKAIYDGAADGLSFTPKETKSEATNKAIEARDEDGQPWSLSDKEIEQISNRTNSPGGMIEDWQGIGRGDLSGEGDEISEYTDVERSTSKYGNTAKDTEKVKQPIGGSGQEVANLIKDSTTSAAAMNNQRENSYGVGTFGNLPAQTQLLNTGKVSNAPNTDLVKNTDYSKVDLSPKKVVSVSDANKGAAAKSSAANKPKSEKKVIKVKK